MLIKHTPDAYEKLQILGGMAGDDILSRPEEGSTARRSRGPYSAPKKNPVAGVYKASMPNGKHINLMRVMFTDFCKMDCAFCPNSHWVPRKRYAFKVDELARTFNELHSRHTVDGLFLSSGVAGTGSKTTEKLVKVVEIIRQKYGFEGYIHLKVMPGTEEQYVEAAYRLGTRQSVNLETPTAEMMRKLSAMKDLERDILDPMRWIDRADQRRHQRRDRSGHPTRRRGRRRDRLRHIPAHRPALLRVEPQAGLLRALPSGPLHASGGASADAHGAVEPALPGRLVEAHLPVLQRRAEAGFRRWRAPASRRRPEDLHRRREPRRLPRRREHGRPHAATPRSRRRPDLGAAHRREPEAPHHRHMAGPSGHGGGTKAGVALPGLSGTAPPEG